MKKPIPIIFSTLFIQSVSIAHSVTGRYEDRIDFLGITFKDPLVLCQILIAIFMAITFLQSGLDKILDRKGNLEFFEAHFTNSPFHGFTRVLLPILTIMETVGGLMLVYGVYFAFAERSTLWILYGFIVLAITLIALFTGQRLTKDYVGAADLVPYFILIMLGIMSMY